MAEKPKNITALLMEAFKAGALAEGKGDALREPTHVYRIPGIKDYLLRVENPSNFLDRLLATTTLTPLHLCSPNIGQKVLDSGLGYQIVQSVPGEPLIKRYDDVYNTALFTHHNDESKAGFLALKDMLELLNSLPREAFIPLVKTFKEITAKGVVADLHFGNILLDKTTNTLGIIDPLEISPTAELFYKNNSAHNLLSVLDGSKWVNFDDGSQEQIEISELRRQLHLKILGVFSEVGYPKTADMLQQELADGHITLNTYKPIDTKLCAALPMSATPADLRAKLQEVQTYSQMLH
jgi:hypothetical protein